jgi:hypothetical protein
MTPEQQLIIERHADALAQALAERTQIVAREVGIEPLAAVEALRKTLLRMTGGILDNRATYWRVRVRLYAAEHVDDPVADSDPDAPPDAAGETVLRGLTAVAEHVALLAGSYHGLLCLGLESATLRHKLKGLRPTLSRRKGNAVWRLSYTTHEATGTRDWLARVDIERTQI